MTVETKSWMASITKILSSAPHEALHRFDCDAVVCAVPVLEAIGPQSMRPSAAGARRA